MSDENLYNSHDVAQRITDYAKKRGIRTTRMLDECNLGRNTISHLRHGKKSSYDAIARIADYLDCSVDYLLGRTDAPNSHKILKGSAARITEIHKLGTVENGKKLIFTAAYSSDNVEAEYIEIDMDELEALKASAESESSNG